MRPLKQSLIPANVFSRFLNVQLPEFVAFDSNKNRSRSFYVKFITDGDIPFPQIIIRTNGRENIYNDNKIRSLLKNEYELEIPEGELPLGTHQIQIEGCRKKEWQQSSGEDWVKWIGEIRITPEAVTSAPSISKNTNKKKNLI